MSALRLAALAATISACAPKSAPVPPGKPPASSDRPLPTKGWEDKKSPDPNADPPKDSAASKEQIRGVVRNNMKAIRGCYNRLLAEQPALRGRVMVRFVIGPEGAVEAAMVEDSTVPSDPLERCVVDVVTQMTFPVPDEGGKTVVSYPFVFEPGASISTTHPTYETAAGLVRIVLRPKIDTCFSKRRRKRESVFVDFRVDAAGNPSRIGVHGLPPASAGLRRCITRAVGQTRMPEPQRVSPVDVTLEL